MKTILIIFFILFTYSTLFSQRLFVYDVDASAFPNIKANFFAFDNTWNQQSPNKNTIVIKENSQTRTISDVSCPTPKTPTLISSVLVMDVSNSMVSKNFAIVRAATLAWINSLKSENSECALTTYDKYNYFNQDFTTDYNKVITTAENLLAGGGTDYNRALIDSMCGGLRATKTGKYQKILVLLTDGLTSSITETNKIIEEAKLQNCKIFVVTIDLPCPKSLKDISTLSGGKWFENVNDVYKADEIYRIIAHLAQGSEPCTVSWTSEANCDFADMHAELSWNGNVATNIYPLPINAVHPLDVQPAIVSFGIVQPGKTEDITIDLTAKDVDYTVSSINLKHGSNVFYVKNVSFPLFIPKNTSKTITLSFSPTDSNLCYGGFEILTNYCSSSFSANGGVYGTKMKQPTLRLTHPNGGEVFVAGVDTLITWEGIMPSDKVNLLYSIDNGQTWKLITNSASGLKYLWKGVPKPAANKCLIKIIQGDVDNIPDIEWQKSLGGSNVDQAQSIQATKDGGFIVAGYTSSFNGDVIGNKGQMDAWLVKLDSKGAVQWRKTYGGSKDEVAYSCKQTKDGGYIFTGYTNSIDGDLQDNEAGNKVWIVKINSTGSIEWLKTYNNSIGVWGTEIQQTTDDGYIISGWTWSGYQDGTEKKSRNDYWVVKLSSAGALEWEKNYGGSKDDEGSSIQQTKDGGYIVGGGSYSSDCDVTDNSGNTDYWVIKLNSSGSIEWQKNFGGSNYDFLYRIKQTLDGGYIATGQTWSSDGDITDYHGGIRDIWLVKLSSSGTLEWQKTLGGSSDECVYDIQLTKDGGYTLVGYTGSVDGDVTEGKGSSDFWIICLNSSGKIEWQKTFGGSDQEWALSVARASDGGYCLAGATNSNDGDITENKGSNDFWIVKLSPEGAALQSDISDAVFSIVTPLASVGDIDMNKCVYGCIKDSVVTSFIKNIGSYKFTVDSIYFRGTDAEAFSIVSSLPEYTITSGGKHQAEIRFAPTKMGAHTADMVIITQADTLIKTIRGDGTKPQVLTKNKFIVFKKVRVGEISDTLQVATITNIGNTPLNISKTIHNRPNIKDFTTISGGGSFTLNPGETKKMDLRFAPSDIGRTSGILEFHYNGVGSPIAVQLFGEAGKSSPRLQVDAGKINDLVCELSTSTNVDLTNTGAETLIIKEIIIKGNNPNDFIISETLPIIIEPDSAKSISVLFKPESNGIKKANIEFKSNAWPDSVSTTQITANSDIVLLRPTSSTINLGMLCPNESKDTIVVLKNSGSKNNVGYAEYSSNISSSIKTFKMNSESTFQLPLTFEGLTNEGVFSEKLIIKDSICGMAQEITVTGTIAQPIISVDDLSITTINLYSKNSKLVVKNNSLRDFTITNIIGLTSSFSLIGNPLPLEVKINSTADIPIKFTPSDVNKDSIQLTLIGIPCSISQNVKIIGGISNFVLIYPENNQTGLELKINFKWSLVNEGKYYQLQISKNNQFTDLVYSKDSLTTTEHFVPDLEPNIRYYWRVRVWNEESIGTAYWSDIWTFTTSTSSVNDGAGLIKIIPNPAGDFITVTLERYTTPSRCWSFEEVSIYNTLGKKVMTVWAENILPLQINISSFPKGIYFVKVGSETAKFVKM